MTYYSKVKNVIMNATDESDLEYATWYWGRYFEVFFTESSEYNPKIQKHIKYRYECAQKWLQEFKNRQSTADSTETEKTEEQQESN